MICVPCRLGYGGIESVLELNLSDRQREGLHTSAQSVRKIIERSQEILAEYNLENPP